MEKSISQFLIDVSKEEISKKQSNEVYALISIARDLESIADIVERAIIPLIEKKKDTDEEFSTEGQEELTTYHLKVIKQIGRLKEAFQEMDMEKANKIMKKMDKNLDLESQYRIKHIIRVQQKVKRSVETHEIHMELLDALNQINVYAGNMAKSILRLSSET
jgi:phosphate:Na+ symporter